MARQGEQKERGGIGLGLAEPELSIQYVVAGGAASDHKGVFEVGDELVAVDGASVTGMRLKEVSALIIGDEGTDVEITIVKAITRERKSIVLTRRGAGKKMPPKKPARPEPLITPQPIQVAMPTFDPPNGHTFPHGASFLTHTVYIHCDTQKLLDVQIRYTMDGTFPAAHPPAGLVYSGGGIQVRDAVTIMAMALARDEASPGGWSVSQVASAFYCFERAAQKTPSPPRSPTPPDPPPADEMQPEEIPRPPMEDVLTPAVPEPEPQAAAQESAAGDEPAQAEESRLQVSEELGPEAREADERAETSLTAQESTPAFVQEDVQDVQEVVQEEQKPQAVRQRLLSAGCTRAGAGMYAHVPSRLHKTTASVRAKDVSMARNPCFGSGRAGELLQKQNLRPQTSAKRPGPAAEDARAAAAQSRDVEALVSPNARLRPNKLLADSSIAIPGWTCAGRRASGASSPCGIRDAGEEYRPRSSCGARDSGGSAAGAPTSQLPSGPSKSAKVLLVNSPLARRNGRVTPAGATWTTGAYFLAEREGERASGESAASRRTSEAACSTGGAGVPSSDGTPGGNALDGQECEAAQRSQGDKFARRSKQGGHGREAGGGGRGGRGARGEWLVLEDQQDLSLPLSLSPLGAAAAASISTTLRRSPTRGSAGAVHSHWTHRNDAASLLGSQLPARSESRAASALALSQGAGTISGWKRQSPLAGGANASSRSAPSLVRSHSADFLLKLERPRPGVAGVGPARGCGTAIPLGQPGRLLGPPGQSPLRFLHKQ